MQSVVFLSRKYSRGEAWCNRLLAYANGFKEKGISVKLLFLISDGTSCKFDDFHGMDVHVLSLNANLANNCKKIVSYIRSLYLIGCHIDKKDIIFTSDGGGLFLLLLHMFFRHNFIFSEITEHPKVTGIPIKSAWKNKQIVKFLDKLYVATNNRLLSKNTGVFTITQSLRKYYIDQNINPRSICVVNMFVDVKRFALEETTCEPYIAYCGTISIEKDGVDILLKSFSLFLQDFPLYKLHLIGRFENERTKAVILNIINEYKLTENVSLVGRVAPEEMPKHLKNAKILALSRPDNLQNRNGFPTKLGEYLATGKPVVATKVGEIPLYINDGENGFLAEPGDVISFYNKLKEVASNYHNSTMVGSRGKKLAYNEFSSETQTQKALNFINSKTI